MYINSIIRTSLCAPTRKVDGKVISRRSQLVEMVTGMGSGLVTLICLELLFLTGVVTSMVPIIPGGVDLKLTW